MRGPKVKGIITILLILFLLINFPVTSIGQVNQEDDINSEVKLYFHLNQTDKLNHELSPIPLNDNQELNNIHDLYFKTSSIGEKYDLIIDGSRDVKLEFCLCCCASKTLLTIEIIISDNNETVLANETVTQFLDYSGYKFNFYLGLNDNEVIINETHELYLNLNFQASPILPASFWTNLKMHSGPDYPSGLSLTVKDPIRVDLQIIDDPENKNLHIHALYTTPFGPENIDGFELAITGPTSESDLNLAIASIPPEGGSQHWIWYYDRDDPKPGTYTIHLNATTCQGVEGEDLYVFELEDSDENEDLNLVMFYIFILFIIALIGIGIFLIYNKRKKFTQNKEK